MTMDERIEAAAKAMRPFWFGQTYDLHGSQEVMLSNYPGMTAEYQKRARSDAAIAIEAAFPELFTDPPTAWIAPWEATPGMIDAYWNATHAITTADNYAAMRDAHIIPLSKIGERKRG